LLIEDNPGDVRLIGAILAESRGIVFDLEPVDSLSAGMEPRAKAQVDLILLDLSLPDSYGIKIIHKVYGQALGALIVVFSGRGMPPSSGQTRDVMSGRAR
jgi:DNA-binding NarL/FixJ family response regulator